MSGHSWTARVVPLLAAVAAAIFMGAPAWAMTTVTTLSLHDDHRGSTAAGFSNHSCAQIPGGAPLAGKDGFVFVLPDNEVDFVSLTVRFKTAAGTTTVVTIPNPSDSYPDGITTNGTSKAWVVVPSGWTLLDASAVISGPTDARFFNLTHTCVGTSPSPSASTSTSTSTSASASSSASSSKSSSKSASPSTSVSVDGSASAESTPSPSVTAPTPYTTAPGSAGGSGGGGGLALTGFAVGGFVLTGAALIAAGALLVMLRRRHDAVEDLNE